MKIILLALFGSFGVIARYGMDSLFANQLATELPLSTLLINCFGSLGIGAIYVAANELNAIPPNLVPLLTVGLLGGFTTFSAFSIQTLQLLENGKLGTGAAYLVASPLAGLACAFAGAFLTRSIFGGQ